MSAPNDEAQAVENDLAELVARFADNHSIANWCSSEGESFEARFRDWLAMRHPGLSARASLVTSVEQEYDPIMGVVQDYANGDTSTNDDEYTGYVLVALQLVVILKPSDFNPLDEEALVDRLRTHLKSLSWASDHWTRDRAIRRAIDRLCK